MKHPDEPTYVDADAPFTQDERARAALLLATTRERAADPSLEERLMSDARAYFDARRAPRAVTTTGGAEVVVGRSDDNVIALPRRRSPWSLAWLAAAAFVGLAVFWSKSHSLPTVGSGQSAPASPSVGAAVSWEAGGAVAVAGLEPPPAGHHYVLWSDPSGTGAPGETAERLAAFDQGGYRYPRALSASGVLVCVEADGIADPVPRTIVLRSRRP